MKRLSLCLCMLLSLTGCGPALILGIEVGAGAAGIIGVTYVLRSLGSPSEHRVERSQ